MKGKILIIEDEVKYAYILDRFFTSDDYEVTIAFDGMSGLAKFKEINPDIICLDIMLPKMDGWEVAKRIREVSSVPIIMMSALSEEQDILKGYTLQIDDYITKPFRIPILIAKTRNLLERRKSLKERGGEEILQVGKIKLIRNNLECYIEDQLVKLTKTEFKLLEYLMLNAGKTCTREQLILILWGDKGIENRIIDTYVKSLRKMLGENATITTVFGIGYKFEKE